MNCDLMSATILQMKKYQINFFSWEIHHYYNANFAFFDLIESDAKKKKTK